MIASTTNVKSIDFDTIICQHYDLFEFT